MIQRTGTNPPMYAMALMCNLGYCLIFVNLKHCLNGSHGTGQKAIKFLYLFLVRSHDCRMLRYWSRLFYTLPVLAFKQGDFEIVTFRHDVLHKLP